MNRDFSLIDANINRIREGLRVVEEICRFVFRNRELFEKLKTLRHALTALEISAGAGSKLSGRVGTDIGFSPVVASEYQRQSLWSILRANFSRAAEAVRVLEEYAKIYFPLQTENIETIRYEIYRLEFDITTLTPHYWLNLYFESGVVYPLSDSAEELIWLIDHGAKIVQLRDKSGDKRVIYQKAKKVCSYISGRKQTEGDSGKILFILNDHPDIASLLPVAGVHVGQGDGTVAAARRIIGTAKIIGRSNHSFEDARRSEAEGADYLSIGPVFATPTKPGRSAVGLSLVKRWSAAARVPWLAIGGIDRDNVAEVYSAGAANIAVVRSARDFFI